jgi:4'-phosphopantetheinyl transferase EntD
MDPTLLADWLTCVSPPGTAAATAPIAALPAFDVAEEAAIHGAVARRRDEFRSGRACARRALAELGCPPSSLPADPRRLPAWPAGFLGSISHGAGICVAQAARSDDFLGLGIDVEASDALDTDLVATISCPDEWPSIARGAASDRVAATLCFSAKEAVYKAYFPSTAAWLDFHDLRLEVQWSRRSFTATLLSPDKPALGGRRSWHGHFLLAGRSLATAVFVPRAAKPKASARSAPTTVPSLFPRVGSRSRPAKPRPKVV